MTIKGERNDFIIYDDFDGDWMFEEGLVPDLADRYAAGAKEPYTPPQFDTRKEEELD